MGQKQKKIRQKDRATGLGQKNKRGYTEKWNHTDSPEIPDRGETSEIPGLPSGVQKEMMLVGRYYHYSHTHSDKKTRFIRIIINQLMK